MARLEGCLVCLFGLTLVVGCSDKAPASEGATQPATTVAAPPTNMAVDEPLLDPAACERALFCDDFEASDPVAGLSAPWSTSENGGTVTVSEDKAYSGTRSVHVSIESGGYKRGMFELKGAPVFPAASTNLFGRMMIWVDATPEGSVHWTFIEASGAGKPYPETTDVTDYRALYRFGGQKQGRLMANYETQGISTDCWEHSTYPMPVVQWACLEWRVDSTLDLMEFWLDGKRLVDMSVTETGEGCIGQDLGGRWLGPAGFDTLTFGWERYQNSNERQVWIDDVAVGTERLGCPPPPSP